MIKAELGVPQERLTGDVLRGRGPRRGNLEALLRHWRKKFRGRPPGSFRRCVISLSDEPGVRQPPHALCAWLMHEVTGKWPREDRKSVLNVRSERLLFRQITREANSAIYEPLNGQQSLVDYKAASFAARQPDDLLYLAWGVIANAGFKEGEPKTTGWHEAAKNWRDQYHEYLDETKDLVPNSVQTVASTVLPGETRPWRAAHPRRIGYSLLFGGGPNGRGGVGGRIGRRIGGNSRNPYRCPSGFEGGGKFTNRSFSTCGAQVLGIPGGNVTAEARRAARDAIRTTTNETPGTATQTEIDTAAVHRAALAKLRGAVPPDIGRPSASKRNSAIRKTMGGLEKATGRDTILQRLVRRDGVVTTPLVSVGKLASLRDNDDLKGSAYLTKFNKPTSSTGVDELGLFGAGVSEVHFSLPGRIRVVATTGKKVSPRDVAALKARAGTLAKKNSFPMGGLVALANESNLFKLSATAPKVSEPNQKVRAKTESGVVRVIPRWIFLTFLSKNAPLRGSGEPVYTLVEEVGGASAEKADLRYDRMDAKVEAYRALIK